VAKNLYLRSGKTYFRNPKQIREHWMNHLDPHICKSEWSPEEDYIIVNTVLENGRKWALAAKLAGSKRTEHMIKNRYHTLLRNEERVGVHSYDKGKVLRAIIKKL
jgi:hypothetical protein